MATEDRDTRKAVPGFHGWVVGALEAMRPPREQRDLSEPMRRSEGSVSKVLRGQSGITLGDIQNIASFLGVSEAEVFARATGAPIGGLMNGAESERARQLEERVQRLEGLLPRLTSEDAAAQGNLVMPDFPTGEALGRSLPVYGYPGAAQKLANVRGDETEITRAVPPDEFAAEVGPNGFGVIVEGDSMEGEEIYDGEIAWANPKDPSIPQPGDVVLALIRREDVHEPKMVIKLLVEDEKGRRLVSSPESAGESYAWRDVAKVTKVIGVSERAPRARRVGRTK